MSWTSFFPMFGISKQTIDGRHEVASPHSPIAMSASAPAALESEMKTRALVYLKQYWPKTSLSV
jgi:hypothetical protein